MEWVWVRPLPPLWELSPHNPVFFSDRVPNWLYSTACYPGIPSDGSSVRNTFIRTSPPPPSLCTQFTYFLLLQKLQFAGGAQGMF